MAVALRFEGADATNVVARVEGTPIFREKFEQALSRRGMGKDVVLEEMIRQQALVAKAKAAGYDRDPELVAAFERMLAARYEEEQLARRAPQISETEIEAAYQRDAAKYTTPSRARAGVIFFGMNSRGPPEVRAEVKQRAEEILTEARRADNTTYAQLVQKYSEDQSTRYTGGDTGWLTRNEPTRWEAEVTEAVFSLKGAAELGPLIATARGFYIVRLTDFKPACLRPLQEVKDGIRYQLTQAKQHQVRLEFLEEAKRGVKVEINQTALDLIPEPTNRAAGQPPPLPGG